MSPLFVGEIPQDTALSLRCTIIPNVPATTVDDVPTPDTFEQYVHFFTEPVADPIPLPEVTQLVSIKMEVVRVEDTVPVESVTAAEDMVFAHAAIYVPKDKALLSAYVNRMCSLIMQRNHRGAGNVLLINLVDLGKLIAETPEPIILGDEIEIKGRWAYAGKFQGGNIHSIYVSDELPVGTIYVAYVAAGHDGPATLLMSEGQLRICITPNTSSNTNGSDFIQKLVLPTN
jgi:hypothetical protein